MSIFLFPSTPLVYCYFFTPQISLPQTQKPLLPEPETPTFSSAEIQKPTPDHTQKISLTRQDLENKGYEQNKKPWTQKEDKLLLHLCKDENARFEEIALLIPDRNAKMCYSRYRRLTNQVKESWTEEQNNRLRSLIEEYGEDWKLIASFFKSKTLFISERNDKQLKDHYLNYLRPNLNKGEWSIDEDLRLIELINMYGKNWKLIEECMKNRSRNQIKNRYFGRIKRIDDEKKKESWSTSI